MLNPLISGFQSSLKKVLCFVFAISFIHFSALICGRSWLYIMLGIYLLEILFSGDRCKYCCR